MLLAVFVHAQQTDKILNYIQQKSAIREGGSSIFSYQETTYVISVAALSVGNKNELNCKKVGLAKAKKEMLLFINGSDITSYTELKTSESINETPGGTQVLAQQQFVEYIKEAVVGTIDQTIPLGGWFSDDRSVYYFAIYKIIE